MEQEGKVTREEIEAALAIIDRNPSSIASSYWTSRLPEATAKRALHALLRALPVVEAARRMRVAGESKAEAWETTHDNLNVRMTAAANEWFASIREVLDAIREFDREVKP